MPVGPSRRKGPKSQSRYPIVAFRSAKVALLSRSERRHCRHGRGFRVGPKYRMPAMCICCAMHAAKKQIAVRNRADAPSHPPLSLRQGEPWLH